MTRDEGNEWTGIHVRLAPYNLVRIRNLICVDSMREPSNGLLTPPRCYLSYVFRNKLLQVILEAVSGLRSSRVGIAPIFSAGDRMIFMRGVSTAASRRRGC